MKIGTKSILFGVHQFAWHPLTVLLAWRKLYKAWPSARQLLAIALHDIGYVGCPNIDGFAGKRHPTRGAHITAYISGLFQGFEFDWPLYFFTAQHSRDWARDIGAEPSALYHADKFSVFYDPAWFYLLRARLSGELAEFKQRAITSGHIPADATDRQWLEFYRANVLARPEIQALLNKD